MENQFYDTDFERWLQDKTRMHRIYPSDAIWKGIYKQLHGHRTWPGLNFFAIITVAALTIVTVIADRPLVQTETKTVAKKQDVAFTSIADHLDPVKATQRTFELIQKRRNQQHTAKADNLADIAVPAATVTASGYLISKKSGLTISISSKPQFSSIASLTAIVNSNLNVEEPVAEAKEGSGKVSILNEEVKVKLKKEVAAVAEIKNVEPERSGVDKYLQEQAEEIIRLNSQTASREPKWGIQFYIAPSASFRELTNKKTVTDNNNSLAPVAPNVDGTDVNEIVNHKPAIGSEFGIAVTYNLTDRLKLKAGGQLNIRQYNIEAYKGATEYASIALVRGGQVDTFNIFAVYRSKDGYMPTMLTNKYYQLSVPIGVELAILKNRKLSVGVGTSLQPTYTITPEASYLITTDYNSYADGTNFLRQWNINSSFEAIFTYKTGNFQWRLSPQLRYQLLSTYVTPYPIKEHLIDYGIKIGFAKSF